MAKKRNKRVARKAIKSSSCYSLKNLLKGVTKKNRHPEINFGPPVGREVL